ncbi:biosynthetic-type acetolactate synthase large subunit [Tissierella creatinophila]|uniref:Acetolactate synthase n=1 Tax=Tissierella creatinophila DSM 6911 TaxID=1123403 RepID=A0A1U7M5R3_TISCR|nr:biosynthetic-type acetolactate synthase large subunit [Tissierella creatinophila]OLS02647.1 acetolactate synthase large subunit [Tissierella creatinophila DSM 6911]
MEKKMINGARILLESLYRLGIRDIFGYPGGTVIPIYDEIYKFEGINHYFSRHEQGAAHEADGYARASGKVGVCLATSGPGATNLVTGIMTAHMDSTPMIAITGQVVSSLLGKDAFQESDIVGITVPITKMNYLIQDIRELPRVIKEAYFIASTGRPGPVLIDIPKDIQTHTITMDEFETIFEEAIDLEGYDPNYHGHPVQIKKARKLIAEAKRPIILAGAGVLKSKASGELLELAEKAQIPVASTLLGLGGFPSSHPLSLGMIGMHGTVSANYATDEADLIIATGMRFDDRITGDTSKFCRGAKVIHIDIDPAEIGKNKCIDVPIVGDLKNVLKELNEKVDKKNHSQWIDKINAWKEEFPRVYVRKGSDRLMPQEVLIKLNSIVKGDAIVTTDVGQHQMWTAQFMDFENPDSIITSGGSGTMGFGLPSSIGAQIAKRDKKVIAIVGDGGFQMTYQELMLLRQYDLPIKIVLLNNSYLGMVRQWQELFNEKRYSFVDLDYNPDFNKIADAYGIKNAIIKTKEELETQLEDLINFDGPVLINAIVEKEANVYPMIPAGADVSKMVGIRGVL